MILLLLLPGVYISGVILARGDTVRFDESVFDAERTSVESHTIEKVVMTHSEIKGRDRRNLIIALDKCRGKVFGAGGAAEPLGMKPTTVTSRIKKYAIDLREFKKAPAM